MVGYGYGIAQRAQSVSPSSNNRAASIGSRRSDGASGSKPLARERRNCTHRERERHTHTHTHRRTQTPRTHTQALSSVLPPPPTLSLSACLASSPGRNLCVSLRRSAAWTRLLRVLRACAVARTAANAAYALNYNEFLRTNQEMSRPIREPIVGGVPCGASRQCRACATHSGHLPSGRPTRRAYLACYYCCGLATPLREYKFWPKGHRN